MKIENIICKCRILCVTVWFHHLVGVCVLNLNCSCCYVILPSLHFFYSLTKFHPIHFIYDSPRHSFHLPYPISLIPSTIVCSIDFIDYSPSPLYLPYLVILVLHCHSVLLLRWIKKQFCLNMLIHEFVRELIPRLMPQSLIFQA